MGNNRLKLVLAFSAVYIIWGSTYLGILIALRTIPPFLMTAMRFLFAGIILLSWRMMSGDRIPSFRSFRQNGLAGILTLFGGVGAVAWAEQYLPSGLAAIIVTAVPFWFVLFDRRQWNFYFSNKIIFAGLLFGFAGVAILVGFSHPDSVAGGGFHRQLLGSLVIIAGGIAWTTGSLYAKYNITEGSPLMNAGFQFLVAGLFGTIVSGLSGEWNHFDPTKISFQSGLALFYLVSFGSLVTYLAYLWLLKIRPAAQVSSYVYVNPVIALLLGAWIAHEKITWLQVLALMVILCGVIMVNIPKYKKIR